MAAIRGSLVVCLGPALFRGQATCGDRYLSVPTLPGLAAGLIHQPLRDNDTRPGEVDVKGVGSFHSTDSGFKLEVEAPRMILAGAMLSVEDLGPPGKEVFTVDDNAILYEKISGSGVSSHQEAELFAEVGELFAGQAPMLESAVAGTSNVWTALIHLRHVI